MSISVKSPSMVEFAWPQAELSSGMLWLRNLGLAFTFSLLMAGAAQVAFPLPFTPVPVTLQPQMALFAGVILGARWGAVAMVLYLVEGLAGLPFFSLGRSGYMHLLGPTGGYLMCYPAVACLTGWLASRGWDKSFSTAVVTMLIGSAIILSCGAAWGLKFVGTGLVFQTYVLPFIPGDVLKVLAAAMALPFAWKFLGYKAR